MKLSNLRFKDLISPKKWYFFVTGSLIRLLTGDASYYEQVYYRISRDECRECVKAGSCSHCGCSMPSAALAKGNKCSAGHWGPMMKKAEWETYKEIYNINL